MIHRPYDEAAIYGSFADMKSWKLIAEEAHKQAVSACPAGVEYEFDRRVWTALKPYQLEYFFGKCAYCESKITAGFWGDVEHFRPKKKVEEEPSHPGYYWTAYSPHNLMPSCQRCNQGKGKKSHFPVAPGTRAYEEGGLAREIPLLLNPYFDKPSDHLAYDFDSVTGRPTGYVRGITEKGRTSVTVYGLNRTELVDERLAAQKDAVAAFELAKLRQEAYISGVNDRRAAYAGARIGAILAWIDWQRLSLERDQAALSGSL